MTKGRDDFGFDEEAEPEFVTCPKCSNEQADMGASVSCEQCGAEMPYYKDGRLVEPS